MAAESQPAARTIGRYVLERELGRGAMGIVYRARDPRIDRPVALKALAPGNVPEDDETTRSVKQRFLNEARAAGRLNHPGIVAVYDADEDPATGTAYLAMEMVDGGDLRGLIRDGLPPEMLLAVISQVAAALDHAHDRGVIHRDIKPANILITDDGQAKLTDFGIARLATSNMTMAGQLLGSPAYMAPEQIKGETVTRASDIFALGIVAYEGLTGRRPFDGGNFNETARAITLMDPRPISDLRPNFAPAVDAVLAKALAKKPHDRPATATAFAEALTAAFSSSETIPTRAGASSPGIKLAVLPRARRSRLLLAGAGGALLVLAVVAWLVLRPGRPAAPPPSAAITQPQAPATPTAATPPPAAAPAVPTPAPRTVPSPPTPTRHPPAPAAPAPSRPAPRAPRVEPAVSAAPGAPAPSRGTPRARLVVDLLTGQPGTLTITDGAMAVGRLEALDLERTKVKKHYVRTFDLGSGRRALAFTFVMDRRAPITATTSCEAGSDGTANVNLVVGRYGGNIDATCH